MEVDRVEVARNWLETSEQDLAIAEEIASRWPAAACFHSQQCGEKAIKAMIVFYAGDALRSQLLSLLLAELTTLDIEVPSEVSTAAQSLAKYYMPTRYPDALGGMSPSDAYTAQDAGLAIEAAWIVFTHACTLITPEAPPTRPLWRE